MTAVASNSVEHVTPLVVDLDGTLIKSDLFFEAIFKQLGKDPAAVLRLLSGLLKGKAHFKDVLARAVQFDPAYLPYDDAVLDLIHEARALGRPVYLASASHRSYVSAIVGHLGLFTGWFGSDATTNISGPNKARLLVETFGDRGFDYIGNDRADILVWAAASKRIGVRTPSGIAKKLSALGVDVIESPKPALAAWLKLLRVHQYAKSALVFLPLLTAHKFGLGSLLDSVLAAVAFSLCASSVYIFNDLVDLSADRGHPTKKNRPLAAGIIPISHAIIVMAVLFLCSTALAAFVSLPFLAVLLFYFALTNAYTCWLKTKMLIDVVVLATLYTLRVIGGAAAIGVTVSEWLLAFSMFIFASLALVKRYVELSIHLDRDLPDPANRNYRLGDMQIVAALAGACGLNAVTVFALYISSDTVRTLYRHPHYLWLVCPILMYWVSRLLMMAHRRLVHDDPVVFALKDRVSIIAGVCVAVIMVLAI
jgi:4-hydroxybenzoate polyprenyltransferase/phosphoglycolate phosphatase-like HAD superfamily hydrolase